MSIKGLKDKAEKGEIEKYLSSQEGAAPSLGRLIQEEIERQGGELLTKKEEE